MKLVASILALLIGAGGVAFAKLPPEQQQKLPPPAARTVEFERDVQPIFAASCVKCHGRGKAKGGFKLDTRESFLKGGDSGAPAETGKSAESLLVELVSGLNPDSVMPMKGSKLNAEQVGLLRAWIDQGMAWNANVSFARPAPMNLHPRQPELPRGKAGANPIDLFLEPYFKAHNFKPAAPVEDRVFARRVYLDAIGLLPTPAELDAFLKDKHADNRSRLVERLLRDKPRYAEHWLSFWNDLLRNDYKGTGYIDGGREQISTWLYRALYNNVPYDRFVAELIDPTDATRGFTKGIVWRGAVNASQTPPLQAAQNISQVFMGVNLKCASCHDSFINDWALADAYALANVYADEPLEIFQCDKPTGRKAGLGFIYPELGDIPVTAKKPERSRRLAEIMTQKQNGRLTRTVVNRLWQRFLGRGLVEPADDMDQPAWNQDLLDWLAEDLAAHRYDLKRTISLILTSRAYQLPAVSLDEKVTKGFVFTGPAVRRMTAEQFRDALGALTGVWNSKAASGINVVVPESPEAAAFALPETVKWIWSQPDAAAKAPAETIRFWKTVTLAEAPSQAWAVASADNSYTLYVNGNKVASGKSWSEPDLFDLKSALKKGTNLIAVAATNHTPANEVPSADKPASPADANPAGFIFFVRVKAGSNTFEIASDKSWTWSRTTNTNWAKPDFVDAEAQPAAELGPPSQAPWQLAPKLASALAMSRPHTDVRASLVASDPLAAALGRPTREQVASTRQASATTLQALELTNGETLNRLLQRGAEKVLAAKPKSNAELVKPLYAKALGRAPTAKELQLADELLGAPLQKDHVEDLLWALAMLPEFQLIR
jgi:mono/diheme cytochrome c family protein